MSDYILFVAKPFFKADPLYFHLERNKVNYRMFPVVKVTLSDIPRELIGRAEPVAWYIHNPVSLYSTLSILSPNFFHKGDIFICKDQELKSIVEHTLEIRSIPVSTEPGICTVQNYQHEEDERQTLVVPALKTIAHKVVNELPGSIRKIKNCIVWETCEFHPISISEIEVSAMFKQLSENYAIYMLVQNCMAIRILLQLMEKVPELRDVGYIVAGKSVVEYARRVNLPNLMTLNSNFPWRVASEVSRIVTRKQ